MHANVQIFIGVCTKAGSNFIDTPSNTVDNRTCSHKHYLVIDSQIENQKNPKGTCVTNRKGETGKENQVFGTSV